MGLLSGQRDPAIRVPTQCARCGAWDDHPRHHHRDIVAGVFSDTAKHLDCCSQEGCPDGSCDKVVAAAGGVTGLSLLPIITAVVDGTDPEAGA